MLGLARYAIKSPLHVGVLAALFAAVPMLYGLSAALVALTTLRFGITSGSRVLAFALVGGVVSWQMSGIPLSMLVLVLMVILAEILRSSQSWTRTLLASLVLGIVLSLIAQVFLSSELNGLLDTMQKVFAGGQRQSTYWQQFESIRPMVGYVLVTMQIIEAVLFLLLARYWQSGLFNPGGLKAEMHTMRFSRQEIIFLVAGAGIFALIQPGMIVLFGFPFIFAGFALVHGIMAKLKLGEQWLASVYIVAVILFQIILPLFVVLVVLDTVIDIRARISERPESDNE